MFNAMESFILCDMSNFTLGIDIKVFKNGAVSYGTVAKTKEEAIALVYNIYGTQDIKNVFIMPLAPMSSEKIMNEFRAYGENNFSKTFDKIQFHMI